MSFHLTCLHINYSSVWVDGWPPFRKYLRTRLTICSHRILIICDFSFWFVWMGVGTDCFSS